ncbi:hypothetical protein KP79_PYT08276 [Mizuhopecten yessoensis]|uniref:Uncharacterized protein n=1 Tax=Mizuhopecten yessoensis TaxID=6573 RepID=A0A210R5K6_MIZYE|nr:hypothetical protein KP79_PYT08276 [Mizuhopecten yessoensis]
MLLQFLVKVDVSTEDIASVCMDANAPPVMAVGDVKRPCVFCHAYTVEDVRHHINVRVLRLTPASDVKNQSVTSPVKTEDSALNRTGANVNMVSNHLSVQSASEMTFLPFHLHTTTTSSLPLVSQSVEEARGSCSAAFNCDRKNNTQSNSKINLNHTTTTKTTTHHDKKKTPKLLITNN